MTAVLAFCPLSGYASNENSTDNLSNAVASTQQANTVSGVVRDNTGEPLIGVSVVVKDNQRVGTVTNMDGLRFLRRCRDKYDLIINDTTDPFGYAEGLFTREFYGSCFRALKEDGIMVYQHGSPFYDEDEEAFRAMHRKAYKSFPINRVYQANIPTCPSGYWMFGFASKKYHPLKDLDAKRWKDRKLKTWYYTTNLHKGAFMLPKYVEDLLEEEERAAKKESKENID